MRKILSFIACLTLTATSLAIPVSADGNIGSDESSGSASQASSANIGEASTDADTTSSDSDSEASNKVCAGTVSMSEDVFTEDSNGNIVIGSNSSLKEIVSLLFEDVATANGETWRTTGEGYSVPLINNINDKYDVQIMGATANGYFKGRIYTEPTKTVESYGSYDSDGNSAGNSTTIYSYDTVFEKGLNQIQVQGVYDRETTLNEYLRFTFGDQSVAVIGCDNYFVIVDEDEAFDYLTTDVLDSLSTLEIEYTDKKITSISLDNYSANADEIEYCEYFKNADSNNVLAWELVKSLYEGNAKPTLSGSGNYMTATTTFTLLGTEYTISLKVTDYNSTADKAVLTVDSISCSQETINYDTTLMLDISNNYIQNGFYGDYYLYNVTVYSDNTINGYYENLTDFSEGEITGTLYDSGNGSITIDNTKIQVSNQIDYLTNLGKITRGDINNDGEINGVDMLLLKRYNLGMYTLKLNQSGPADVNGDNSIDGRDLLQVKKYLLGLIDSLT
jgi:hypothetical protein